MSSQTRRHLIASKIKSLREQIGMTQKDFADYVGLAPTTISSYETGHRSPDIQTLEIIADKLNVPIAEILCLDNTETTTLSGVEVPNELKNLDIESIQILKELKESGMDADEIKAVLELVKTIRKTK
ncbi:MAG: helix-turn-helix domain-containing protein [Acidaminobacter sp.]|uniref:helix-turn-helix domain-containing protein n=1 Tax=Acidaminobacter sp. TaxID=1872102 RepID=UPI0013813630|nr:helix-turn-helix transcriptional regulator [Acidaminobacter sp.]MZQ99509.1 helix-turn-helix domain-containing protein [Acidaminobacter sp.]